MTLVPPSELRDVRGIGDSQRIAIKAFLQGAVYSWVKNRSGEPFAVRDLVGGDNRNWEGTPLQELFNKHIGQGKSTEDAAEAAARDLGWLIKTVLAEDKRTFEVAKAGLVSHYRWIGGEP